MKIKTSLTISFSCSVERAFKTPILCDATKIHTGYGLMPPVTHFTDDETWGQPGGHRMVHVAKNILLKPGEWALDTVLERINNQYWKWMLSDFRQWGMGVSKLEGEWRVKDISKGRAEVTYSYTLFSGNVFGYPFYWIFLKTVWRSYMRHALENIKGMAEHEAPYLKD